MFKKLLPASLIAVSVALVAAGSAALAVNMADRNDEDDLVDHVAAELGLEPETVSGALAQAQREQADERYETALAEMVERGVITQEQADSALAWLDARPASADRVIGKGALLPVVLRHGGPFIIDEEEARHGSSLGDDALLERMAEILGVDVDGLKDAVENAESGQARERREEAINSMIDSLVESGELTGAEGEEIKAWLADMPEWISEADWPGFLGGQPPKLPFFKFDEDFPRGEAIIPEGFPFDSHGELRFRFDGPGDRFEFNGAEGRLPGDIGDILEQLEGQFDFEFEGRGPSGEWRVLPTPDTDVTPQPGDSEAADKSA